MKTEEEIRARLAEIEADERLQRPPAKVDINAPLALVQVGLEEASNTLRWVLGLPHCYHNPKGQWVEAGGLTQRAIEEACCGADDSPTGPDEEDIQLMVEEFEADERGWEGKTSKAKGD